jgi:hypothetical protein
MNVRQCRTRRTLRNGKQPGLGTVKPSPAVLARKRVMGRAKRAYQSTLLPPELVVLAQCQPTVPPPQDAAQHHHAAQIASLVLDQLIENVWHSRPHASLSKLYLMICQEPERTDAARSTVRLPALGAPSLTRVLRNARRLVEGHQPEKKRRLGGAAQQYHRGQRRLNLIHKTCQRHYRYACADIEVNLNTRAGALVRKVYLHTIVDTLSGGVLFPDVRLTPRSCEAIARWLMTIGRSALSHHTK